MNMETFHPVRPIRTQRDHQAALKAAELLWDVPKGSPEADRLEVLMLVIEAYEREHEFIDDPDPIDLLHHVMDARGLTRKDLERYIGSRARVAEVLNRVRLLSLEMIRRLVEGLDLPADVLIKGYNVRRAA